MKSKKVEYWNHGRETKLKPMFQLKRITTCEINIEGRCVHNNFLGFAHRHERDFFNDCPELLFDFTQVLLACQPCHDYIDTHRDEREKIFMQKRGKENKPENKVVKSKKADWMKPRICKHCKAHNPGMAMCPNCKKFDM